MAASRTEATDLTAAIAGLRPEGALVRQRLIAPGDDLALFADEFASLGGSVEKVRRQSGAARRIARELLVEIGAPPVSLPRQGHRPLIWPAGIVGSLAHDDEVAIAAVARTDRLASIGIDVEPAAPLPPELVRMVATERERRLYDLNLLQSRALFSIKEAVYKAVNPIDHVFLEFGDVEVDLDAGQARVAGGRFVAFRWIRQPRIVALAYIPVA